MADPPPALGEANFHRHPSAMVLRLPDEKPTSTFLSIHPKFIFSRYNTFTSSLGNQLKLVEVYNGVTDDTNPSSVPYGHVLPACACAGKPLSVPTGNLRPAAITIQLLTGCIRINRLGKYSDSFTPHFYLRYPSVPKV